MLCIACMDTFQNFCAQSSFDVTRQLRQDWHVTFANADVSWTFCIVSSKPLSKVKCRQPHCCSLPVDAGYSTVMMTWWLLQLQPFTTFISLSVPQNCVGGGCWVGVLWACLSTGAGNSQWGCWAPRRPSLAFCGLYPVLWCSVVFCGTLCCSGILFVTLLQIILCVEQGGVAEVVWSCIVCSSSRETWM